MTKTAIFRGSFLSCNVKSLLIVREKQKRVKKQKKKRMKVDEKLVKTKFHYFS